MATNKKIQKATAKPQAKSKAAAKPAAKVTKKPVAAVKTVKKVAAKPVAKKAAPVAKKAQVKQAAKPVSAPKKSTPAAKVTPKKAAVTPSAKKVSAVKATVTPSKGAAISMKPATNQNPVAKADEKPAAKPAVILQKPAEGLKAVSPNSAAVARPVYRPIQVINKSLAPLQPVRQMAPVAAAAEKIEYKKGDYVVYPAHGVGQIEAVESNTIAGMEIKVYAIVFEKDRMRLKVPVFKAQASGLRKLSNTNRMQDALKTLQGRAQIRRAMWSRRAQEYEMKINSGDPVAIAEVLRDLKRSNDDTEQSYSERQIYQSALERLAREVAAVEKITEIEAAERLEGMIKGRRSRSAEKAEVEGKEEAKKASVEAA